MSFITQPTNIAYANSPILYDVYNSNYNQTDFKYNLRVYVWTGDVSSVPSTPTYELEKQPNSANKAVFDVSRLIREHIKVQHPNDLTLTLNDSVNDIVWVKCIMSGSYDGGTIPAVESNVILVTRGYTWYDDAKVNWNNQTHLGNTFPNSYETFIAHDSGIVEAIGCIDNALIEPYEYDYPSGGFLPTYAPLNYKISENGLLSLALFTDYVDSVVIADDNGNSYTIAVSTGTTSQSKLKYLNCSPSQLSLFGLAYTNQYTITASYNSVQYASTYTIEVLCESKYEPMQLIYLNKLGVWDYFTFFKRSNQNIQATRTTFMKNALDYGNSTTSVSYNPANGERGTFLTNGYRTYTLNSGFVEEKEGQRIEQLLLSEKVILRTKQVTYAVEVTDTGMSIKKNANDKLINYTINIKDGHRRINKVNS